MTEIRPYRYAGARPAVDLSMRMNLCATSTEFVGTCSEITQSEVVLRLVCDRLLRSCCGLGVRES